MALPRLESRTLLPDQYSDRSRALALLRRIETIEIRHAVRHRGARHYAVDVHYKVAPHGIPTNHTTKRRARLPDEPSVRVLRRFSEFSNLCDEMYFHAHSGHDTLGSCAFCGAFSTYVTTSATQPRLALKLFHGHDTVRVLLERFLNDVVGMTVRGVKAFGGRECLGQDHVPQLLLEFLLPQEASPLGEAAIQLSVQALRVATAEARLREDEGGDWIGV